MSSSARIMFAWIRGEIDAAELLPDQRDQAIKTTLAHLDGVTQSRDAATIEHAQRLGNFLELAASNPVWFKSAKDALAEWAMFEADRRDDAALEQSVKTVIRN